VDLWQAILADHANIKELCREVLAALDTGPNSRARLFNELETEWHRHIRAKESVLYPVLARDPRTSTYLAELTRERDEIEARLDLLASRGDINVRAWALDFKELTSVVGHYFNLEEHGVLLLGRATIDPEEAEDLRRAFEREVIASLQARRWHLPEAVMPSRYGLSTGAVLSALAGAAAIGTALALWRRSKAPARRPLRPVYRRPEPPFPLPWQTPVGERAQ
jgi:hypothetical protein